MAFTSQFQAADEATGECAECTSTALYHPLQDKSSNIPISEHNYVLQ